MVIVLDCNIWVSLAINRQIDFVIELINNEVEIMSCETLRDEIADINQPNTKKMQQNYDTTMKILDSSQF